MELELKHLAPYLPYGLKWTLQELKEFTMSGITKETLYTEDGTVLNWQKGEFPQALFPILRPLSDLTKEIEVNGVFVNIPKQLHIMGLRIDGLSAFGIEQYIIKNPLKVDYWAMQNLLELHFDVFGLIERGLAIDINTLK